MNILLKVIFLCIACFPISLIGQSTPSDAVCQKLTKNVQNEETLVSRVVSIPEIRLNDLGGHGLFQVIVMRSLKDYSIIIKSLDNECFDNDTDVDFYFRDGSSIRFKSSNKTNCESLLLVSMGGIFNNVDKIENFLDSYLIGIGFQSSKKFPYRLKIETPNTELVQELFECMVAAY